MRGIFSRSGMSGVLVVMGMMFMGATSAAAWSDGGFSHTDTVNCVSMIQGSPYTEVLTTEYMGYGPGPALPKVGDVYYGRIVLNTSGNPCAGPYVHVEVALPKNTEFAVDAGHPIECWNERLAPPGSTWQPAPYRQITDGSCPTQPGRGIYGTGFYSLDSNPAPGWNGGPWPLPIGGLIYIYFPLRSSVPLNGMGGTGTLLAGAVQTRPQSGLRLSSQSETI